MPLNPWLVDNIEAFSFYCCPECVFRSKEENFFQVHALQNHGLAKSFFLDPEKNGTESNQSIFYGDKTNQVQVKKEVFEKDEGNIIPKVKLEIDDDLEWNSSWQFKDPLFMPVLSQSRKKDSRNQTQEHVERSHTYKCEQWGKRLEIVMNELRKNQNFHFDLQIHPKLFNSTYLHCQMTEFISIRA